VILLAIIIIVSAFFIFPLFFLGLFFRDIASIDASNLCFQKTEVPQDQNVYYDFISLEERDGVKLSIFGEKTLRQKAKIRYIIGFLLPCPVKVIQKNLVEAQAPRRSGDAYPASKKDVLGKLEN